MSTLTLRNRVRLYHAAAQSPHLQAVLMRLCRRSPVFWFNTFCWTYDPRQRQPVRPFTLYPFQRRFIHQLFSRHLQQGHDVLVEKSRDMGASWLTVLLFQHGWLFDDNAQFLLGSRKMGLVDTRGDRSTLFEKLRFNLRLLPHWMRPTGFRFNTHDLCGRLINPVNGNLIAGEASTANFARGGRYKAVLMDEFAFWPLADHAYTAAGQSSPCRVVVSTPYGKSNKFADLRFNSSMPRLRLHWSQHPDKTQAWYEQQAARMTVDERARELDINYNLSVRDRVYAEFTHAHRRELTYNPHGKLIRVWDFGYHTPACLWLQVDERGRLLVLRERVGQREILEGFVKRVLADTQTHYGDALAVVDWCDPAGTQRSDKLDETSVDILNRHKVYPQYQRTGLKEGIERVRHLLVQQRDGLPALLVDERHCPTTVTALEGGYRYRPNAPEEPLEEHPYEDVMDCLRYAAMAVGRLFDPAEGYYRKHRPRRYNRPWNQFTGY